MEGRFLAVGKRYGRFGTVALEGDWTRVAVATDSPAEPGTSGVALSYGKLLSNQPMATRRFVRRDGHLSQLAPGP